MLITWFEKNNVISWIITFFGASLIFYISSIVVSLGGGGNFLPQIYHFSAFFLLCFFLLISLHSGKWAKKKFIFGLVIVVLYAISDEIHQLFVPGRFFSYLDILIDFIGIFFASAIYYKRLK